MRTLIIIAGGLVLLGLCMLIGRLTTLGPAMLALIFIPLWLTAAAANMWVGVTRAGYSVGEEFPIFLAIFAIPAVAAFVLWTTAIMVVVAVRETLALRRPARATAHV